MSEEIRSVYKFRLGWKYSTLHAMDRICITDPSISSTPLDLRVLHVEMDYSLPDIGIVAEDFRDGYSGIIP